MAPSAVLLQPLTIPTPPNLTNLIMSSSHTNHNYSSLTDFTGGPSTSHFGVYQQTSVGTSDVTMRTLVPSAIGAEPYRKELIAKLFFRQILPLTDATYVSFSNLITTVSLYFSINTGSSERESAAAVVSIRSNFFLLLTCRKLGSRIPSLNPLMSRIQPSALHILPTLPFVSLFPYISLINELRKKTLSLEFSLRLP